MSTEPLHYTAFADAPHGGNPAGVVPDASRLDAEDMQVLASELGYPESAFVVSLTHPSEPGGVARVGMRYFTPAAEIPFCGHATVATAVELFDAHGFAEMLFETPAGEVAISASRDAGGEAVVSFTSVEPAVRELDPLALERLLEILALREDDLAPGFPALESFAGNWHPVLVLRERELFHQFRFDPRALAPLMTQRGWTGTVTVLSPLGEALYEARNLFPVGRLTEDPATGSAAASTGAYLRHVGRAPTGGRVKILQGAHVGRPSRLLVDIPAEDGIRVSGGARRFTPAASRG
ncbi:PhzF family phenazine biosynthesis protein [Galactobacter valiniphilus]|uniref:PhzF family phenazine biosynthesis protein n=1 Tax=Galactobacter valiniphilus TaxID=2676122 RepID=UPI003734F918